MSIAGILSLSAIRARKPWWNVGITSVISALLATLVGVGMVVEAWDAFQRFHGEDMIPLFAEMAIVRSMGASSATLIACLHVAALFHSLDRAASLGLEVGRIESFTRRRLRTALLAAAAAPIAYVPVIALAMCGAMLTGYLGLGLRPAAFLARVSADDVGRGAFTALLMGVAPAVWSLVGRKLFANRKRGLGYKLLATWLLLIGFSIALRVGAAIVVPDEPTAPLQVEPSPTE